MAKEGVLETLSYEVMVPLANGLRVPPVFERYMYMYFLHALNVMSQIKTLQWRHETHALTVSFHLHSVDSRDTNAVGTAGCDMFPKH